jgi:hypothetical protein
MPAPIMITFKGEILNITQWASRIGVTRVCLGTRLRTMAVEDALSPVKYHTKTSEWRAKVSKANLKNSQVKKPSKHGVLTDEKLFDLYFNKSWPITYIADRYQRDKSTVWNRLRRHPDYAPVAAVRHASAQERGVDLMVQTRLNRAEEIEHNGTSSTFKEIARGSERKRLTIRHRIKSGMSVEQAVSADLRQYRKLTHQGETLTVGQWAKQLHVSYATLNYRITHGWSTENTLTSGVRKNRPRQRVATPSER